MLLIYPTALIDGFELPPDPITSPHLHPGHPGLSRRRLSPGFLPEPLSSAASFISYPHSVYSPHSSLSDPDET